MARLVNRRIRLGAKRLGVVHPRHEIIDMLEAGVSGMRDPVQVKVGFDVRKFEKRTVTHAIYATAWDCDLVLEAGADGVFRANRGEALTDW